MPSPFMEVDITANAELIEQLIGVLTQIGFEGFWEDDTLLKCYINSRRWRPEMLDEVRATVNRMARSSSSSLPQVTARTVESMDWNREWEKTIKPIQATDRIVIKPTWHEYDAAPGQIVVTIDPKMSFGTGYHETTRLVLKLMEKYVKTDCSLLDVGTGTGILAIAGVKLGAASAVAVDVDEWSYDNAVENCRLNDVEEKIHVIHGELSSIPSARFTMIVANIQLNIIAEMLQEIKGRLAPGGLIILSGLLGSDREHIMSLLEKCSLELHEEMSENEWLALVAGD